MELEFSPVKTIKMVNKETLLKTVYNSSNEEFNFQKLSTLAEREMLSDDVLGSLKSIFDEVICQRDDYTKTYESIEDTKKRPRRYGKKQIEKDIEAQGGKATELQLTMLSLNELKSAYINLHGKGTADWYDGTNKLSESEGRAIRAAIRTFMKQVKPMLNRRR